MHELGILYHVVEQVVSVAKANRLTRVERLVLQVGEMSGVIPRFLTACYPAAADGTLLENTELQIETVQARGRCRACGQEFALVEHRRTCPQCASREHEILSGREFMIKEIAGY